MKMGRKRKPLRFGPLQRNGIRIVVENGGMVLKALDYHADPIHLTREELRELGIVVPRKEPAGLQPSAALKWRTNVSRWEPKGTLPEERCYLGEFVVARVDGGMDVFVVAYSATGKVVEPAVLTDLGLRVRKTPLRPSRRRRRKVEPERRDS
jgi:hypothetical protein